MINLPLLDSFIFGKIFFGELIAKEYVRAILTAAAFSLHWYRKFKK